MFVLLQFVNVHIVKMASSETTITSIFIILDEVFCSEISISVCRSGKIATLHELLLELVPLLLFTLILQLLTDVKILAFTGLAVCLCVQLNWESVNVFKEDILFHLTLFFCHFLKLSYLTLGCIRHCPLQLPIINLADCVGFLRFFSTSLDNGAKLGRQGRYCYQCAPCLIILLRVKEDLLGVDMGTIDVHVT